VEFWFRVDVREMGSGGGIRGSPKITTKNVINNQEQKPTPQVYFFVIS
jgi:hypothetical protein